MTNFNDYSTRKLKRKYLASIRHTWLRQRDWRISYGTELKHESYRNSLKEELKRRGWNV